MTDIAFIAFIAAREEFRDDYDCRWLGYCDDAENAELAMGIVVLFKVFKANQLAEQHNKKLFKKLFGVKKPKFSFNYLNDKKTSELSLGFPLN